MPEISIEEKLLAELEKITGQFSQKCDFETLELENLLKDFISLNEETFHELLAEHDPLQIIEQEKIAMIKSSTENLMSCPCLIIFHGAPKTDFQYWANKTARLLKMPAKSIDRIIVDALISGLTPASRSVKLTIEEYYLNNFESETVELDLEHVPFSMVPDSDPYYELTRKIDALIWLKNRISNSQANKRGKSTSPASTPKTKSRQKTAPKFPTDWHDCLLNISLSLLREIILESINREEKGLVVETLANKFIEDPLKALTVLLSCCDVQNPVHFVSLFADYKTWKSNSGSIDKETMRPTDNNQIQAGTPQLTKQSTPSSARKEKKKTSSSKSSKKQKLHPDDNKHSTEEVLLEAGFKNYGIELSSFLFLLGSWVPMINPQDGFEKKFNNVLSIVRKVFPNKGGKKSDSQKQTKSTSKEQGKFKFSVGLSNSDGTSPGVDVWIFDFRKNHLNNINNFIRILKMMEKKIVEEGPCEPENPFCKDTSYLIMKKPAIRQIHDHTDKGFSLISERHSLSKDEELASISPSISESLKNSEEISVKRLKGLESKFKKSKKKSNAGKKKGRKSVEPFSRPSDLTSDLLPSSDPTNVSCQIVRKESTLISRVLLEPGGTHTWQIVFEPRHIGHYKDAYDLQVARGRKLYQIKCSGKCDFPSVNFDPAVVFSEVAESHGKSKNKKKIFLKDIETFSFGSLFVKPDCGSETRESNTTAATLRFVNDSELDVEMDLAFNEESEYRNQNFSFAPSKLFISRSSHKHVSVWAHPVAAGEHEATLICSIKENPQIHSIKLSCSGVIPEVEFLPPVITLSHVLIGKKSIHNLNIINKCDLPIIFEVTDVASLVKGLSIAPANGVVKEHAEEVVAFEYTSSKVEVVQKQVEFKFYEDEPTKTLLFSKSINFHVECYEVSVDVIFPKKGISSVDFGIMKIGEKNDRAFSLKNKGKFGIGFEVDVIKVPGLNIHPKEFLSVEPKSGAILPGKMMNLKVICSCSAPVIIVDSPAIRIRIMESHSTGSEASVISIPVTVKSYYSSFKISPNVAINFGPILSDSEREMQLQIENTGLFDFKYAVLNPQLVNNTNPDFFEPPKKVTPKSKKDQASSKKSSSAKTKSKPEHLEIEPFIIRDSCGTVKPGSVANMKVICKNPRLGDCVTDVLIKISGSDHPDGVTYKLLAYGCSPQIDISNLDAIFHEAHLQDEFQPNSFETVFEPKIIFSKRDLVLVFYNTLVGGTANINVHFSNTDRLPCDLSFEVTSSTDIACFTVHPIRETIGPLSSKLFTISFNPKKFEIVSGEAVITTGKEVLRIKLIGEGVLPQLEIVKPLSASKNNVIIPFEPTLLSYSTVKAFTLRNVGKIRCKIVIEELDCESKVFHWRMMPEIHHSEHGFEGLLDKIEADMKSIILLNPLEERDFEVKFLPDTIDSFTCKLKLLLVNNPYESYSITMIGSSYQDDVIMRDVTRIDSKESADLLKSLKFVPDSKFLAAYAAEYGAVYLGQCKEKSFQICNLSNDFHRFEWEDLGNVTVSPKSGLVYPNCCEEICMTFHSEEPITPLFKMPVVCSFMRVELHSDVDALKESSFESTSLSKDCHDYILLEPMGSAVEPEYTVIEDTCQQIVVIATGVVDNPVPFCEINSITFPETLLFQVSGRTFDVTNNSCVPLSFEWRFKDASSDRLEERKLSGSAVASRVSFGTTQPRFNNILNEIIGPPICRRKNTVKPNTAHNRYCSAKPLPSSVSLMKRPSTAMHLKETPNFSDPPIQYNKHPFSISSMSGIIQANETVSFEVSFAPVVRGIHSLLLHLRVKGLTTACEQLQIDLSGSGVSPVCHLLVATSDCLSAGRHRSCLSVQPHCKVIEFEVLGSTNPVTKSFDIVNTTGNPYWFTLKQVAPLNSPFSCLTPDGEIEPFKQNTLSFVLFPQEPGTFESLWHLEIPNLDVMQPFLIVGKAREPSVSLSSSHVYMQHTFVGVPVSCTVSLLNNENVDLNFKIFWAEGYNQTKAIRRR
ncbi:hydrocephalus-inducing protein [Nilaparvata lugens]|uniref:hydrocephalus-inducing protein n=1 Tax=Nilaparvata lugens TaxID=108931 RepID=UPI00193E0C23|nr:hydrocephalus-inducing protein [Nilaparvata lugens]